MARSIRETQRRDTNGRAADDTTTPPIAVWLLVALAVPRVLRLLYPSMWPEDDCYLQSAYAVSVGLSPYVDFVQPHLPLLEWIAAIYIKLVGASHVRMELLNGAAIYVTSILTFAIGQRALGRAGGTAAALLFAWSSLVFRYHLWAREFFVDVFVLSAVLVALDAKRSSARRAAWLAILLVLACAIKLTAVIPAVVLLGFVAIVERRWKTPVHAGLGMALGLGGLALFCYSRYGFEFVFQTVLFHFFKGRDPVGAGPLYPTAILDVLAPLLLLGLVATIEQKAANRALGATLAILAAEYLYYGFLSPTAWGHNYLEALPFIAIVAGGGVAWIGRAAGCFRSRAGEPSPSLLRLCAAGALIAIALTWVTPLVNENWERNSVYGFGFIPRHEVNVLARALKNATSPSEDVIAPSFISFEANRRQLIRYPENLGVLRAAQATWRTDGFAAARARFGRTDFFQLINETSPIWNDLFIRAVSPTGPVDAVIVDAPIQLLPLINATDEALTQRGFRPVLRTFHFTLWARGGDFDPLSMSGPRQSKVLALRAARPGAS